MTAAYPGALRATVTARVAHRALIATAAHLEDDGLVLDRAAVEVVGDVVHDLDGIVAGDIEPGRADDGLPYTFAARVAAEWRARRPAPPSKRGRAG